MNDCLTILPAAHRNYAASLIQKPAREMLAALCLRFRVIAYHPDMLRDGDVVLWHAKDGRLHASCFDANAQQFVLASKQVPLKLFTKRPKPEWIVREK